MIKALLLSLCLFPVLLPAAGIRIRGARTGNWWTLKEPVVFKAEGAVAATDEFAGTICDSAGRTVKVVTVDGRAMLSAGWQWQPEQPGFYTVTFTRNGAKVTEGIAHRVAPTGGGAAVTENIRRSSHNIAVLANPPRPPADSPVNFGLSMGWSMGTQTKIAAHLHCAELIGTHFLRIQPIFWDKIETARGNFDWTMEDYLLNTAHRRGFTLIGNPWGTPKWALKNPDPGINITKRYNGQMPDRLADWTDFLTVLVKRYPFIREWELWNEPGLKGQSCFWYGTPDEICALIRAGAGTIKKLQPDAVIWNAAPFPELYEVMLKKGLGQYFDKLSRHGKWTDPKAFDESEKKYGVSKPWTNLEWHAILVSAGDHPYPSEETLSANMLLDFMNQVRQGGSRLALHALFNSREMEMLDFCRKNGNNWTHATGLFRTQPYIEPRLPAVVLRNFIDCFSGTAEYVDGYIFQGEQCASLMKSQAGDVLFFWHNSASAMTIAPALLRAVGKNSILTDWEGRTVKPESGLKLGSGVVYFLRHPDMAAIARWSNRFQVLRRYREKPELDMSVNGNYTPGKLFSVDLELNPAVKPKWLAVERYVTMNKGRKQDGFAARYAIAFDLSGLDLLVEVKDPLHAQPFKESRIWGGDGVQFALDTTGEGYQDYRLEFSAALLDDGKPLLWKQKSPKFDGFLLPRCTEQMKPVKYGTVKIERISGGLQYKIHLDQDELYPFRYAPGKPVRFALLVNNHEGTERAGYLEWATGIGMYKVPARYGNLTVAAARKEVFKPTSLQFAMGSGVLERKGGTVRIVSTAKQHNSAAFISTQKAAVTPGAAYEISFAARGDISLHGMFTLYREKTDKKQRFDFMKRTRLTDDWKNFREKVIIPAETAQLSLSLFCWHQDGWFEIRDLVMKAAE